MMNKEQKRAQRKRAKALRKLQLKIKREAYSLPGYEFPQIVISGSGKFIPPKE